MGEKALTEQEQRTMMQLYNETIKRIDGVLTVLERINDDTTTHENIDFRIREEKENLHQMRRHLHQLNETFQALDKTEFS